MTVKQKGKIFFIMGNSGSGKGTLIKNLKKETNLDLTFIKSYVTRQMRPGEKNGDSYFFITLDEFKKSIKNDEFLEYKLVHNLNYYATKKYDAIDNGIDKGKNIIKEIDTEGLKDILKNYPNLKNHIKSIFLSSSVETLKKRIEIRQGKIDENILENRIKSLKKEIKEAKVYCDYIIETDKKTPEEVFDKTIKIIKENI